MSPQHLDFSQSEPEPFNEAARRFGDWLRLRALPIWATLGQADSGAFAEILSCDGRGAPTSRRTRVQARQIYVYAEAGRWGWQGPWKRAVVTGLERLFDDYRRDDGQFRTLLTADGAPLDETAMVYDQAFVMLALAAAKAANVNTGPWGDLQRPATALRDGLVARALQNGAIIEGGEAAWQSNCHMHLLEAAMAWEAVDGNPAWVTLTNRLADLARSTFIDPDGGFLREFFGSDWRPAAGDEGRLVEPGHQFEWSWLMARYARARNDDSALAVARRLFEQGARGIVEAQGVAVDSMNDDGSIRSDRARLWPQTEWLKASLILAEAAGDDRQRYLAHAATALRALSLYLTPDGLWRDKRLPDGSFIDEPAPASSFYHIMAGFGQASATAQTGIIDGLSELSLA